MPTVKWAGGERRAVGTHVRDPVSEEVSSTNGLRLRT